ncbi:hypothetical protein [Salinimonas chungwhensis]|uniref:hypothetical protein n=1 Tax=Salinimonas chungwhensis TaxID=265425 RepID=UPI000374643A|nr:hypothetical protein [Salinimonas chungwhensis]
MTQRNNLDEMRAAILSTEHTQVAAVFDTEASARASVDEVEDATDVTESQVTFVSPMDDTFSQKLEADSKKLGKHMWYAHLILGAAGLLVGLIAGWLLVSFGPALTQSNPLFTYIAMISPGIFVGLFVAGLISLRPDRSEIIDTVRHAIRRKHYAVIINMKKNQSVKNVAEILSKTSHKVVEAAS